MYCNRNRARGRIGTKMIALTLFLTLAASVNLQEIQPRITNGVIITDISKHPYMVSIRLGRTHKCNGVLLDTRNVLTSANCFDEKGMVAANVTVVLGETYTGAQLTKEKYINVTKIVKHEDYRKPYDDLAMVRLGVNVTFSSVVRSIPRWNDTKKGLPQGCQVLGYGYNGKNSGVLYAGIVDVFRDQCQFNNAKGFCLPAMYRDACEGDSGAPYVCDGKLVGIAGWSSNCNDLSRYYANVTSYSSWITQKSAANQLVPMVLGTILAVVISKL